MVLSGGGDDPLAWGRVAEEVRDGRGRVDKGKLNVHVPRVCHVHSGFPASQLSSLTSLTAHLPPLIAHKPRHPHHLHRHAVPLPPP